MVAGYEHITVTPTGGPLGAQVTDVDLRRADTPEVRAEIRRAWLDHLVLAFPDQPLTSDEYLAFARTIGEPTAYPMLTGLPDHPEITEVKKLPEETINFGGLWHSDTVYLDRPPMASMLIARTVPEVGGDTQFANMYLAWEALDPPTQKALAGRTAHHTSSLASAAVTRADRISEKGTETGAVFTSQHPVMRTHPETGRAALYVNPAHTHHIEGFAPDDAAELLDRLFAHQCEERFVWQHRWEADMVVLWDNRCSLHNPLNDYQGHLRVMHRITLLGDVPS